MFVPILFTFRTQDMQDGELAVNIESEQLGDVIAARNVVYNGKMQLAQMVEERGEILSPRKVMQFFHLPCPVQIADMEIAEWNIEIDWQHMPLCDFAVVRNMPRESDFLQEEEPF